MRQGFGCNIGDHWQVTAQAETEKRVEIEKKGRNREKGRNGDQDNIDRIGNGILGNSGVVWSGWSGLVESRMGWTEWNGRVGKTLLETSEMDLVKI